MGDDLPPGIYTVQLENADEIIGGRLDGDLRLVYRELTTGAVLTEVLRLDLEVPDDA